MGAVGVEHGGGGVAFAEGEGGVRCGEFDAVVVRRPGEGGRGLALVELCADAWGSFVMGPAQGKVVWFELLSDVPGRVAA